MRKMKNSGIEWIGEIPEEWGSNPLRQVIVSRDGGAWGDDPEENNNAVICLRIADFDYEKGVFKNTPENELTYRKYTYIQKLRLTLKLGDILIEKSGGGEKTPVGRAVLFDKDCNALFANFMDRIRVNPAIVSASFVMYWLKALYSCQVTPNYIKQTTGIQNLDLTMLLAKERIMYPEINSQLSIVSYLDSRCSKIDGLVSDIEKQITTLEQYKRSVITEAVTKGLHPAVPMKDSGIEWIGEIPEEWKVKPVYCYFGERKYRNYRAAETNLLSLSYGKIVRKDINTNEGLLPESFNTYNIVEDGDIIIRPTDLQNDKKSLRTGLCKERGIITSAYIALKPIQPANTDYFHYLLHSYDIMKVFYNMGNGVRQGLNFSEFSRLMLLEPPRNQQDEIVTYLDSKCSEIDSAISLKKQQIETLNDYKKSLIYEYVTGKKEIPA